MKKILSFFNNILGEKVKYKIIEYTETMTTKLFIWYFIENVFIYEKDKSHW